MSEHYDDDMAYQQAAEERRRRRQARRRRERNMRIAIIAVFFDNRNRSSGNYYSKICYKGKQRSRWNRNSQQWSGRNCRGGKRTFHGSCYRTDNRNTCNRSYD